jgi:hypothetical protein
LLLIEKGAQHRFANEKLSFLPRAGKRLKLPGKEGLVFNSGGAGMGQAYRTRQDKATRQDKTRQDKTKQGMTRQGKTRQDKTRQDKTRQDKARQDMTRRNTTRHTLCVFFPNIPIGSKVFAHFFEVFSRAVIDKWVMEYNREEVS